MYLTFLLTQAIIAASVAALPTSSLAAHDSSSPATVVVMPYQSGGTLCAPSSAFLSVSQFPCSALRVASSPPTTTTIGTLLGHSCAPHHPTALPVVCIGSGSVHPPPARTVFATGPAQAVDVTAGQPYTVTAPATFPTLLPSIFANPTAKSVSLKVIFDIVFAIILFIALNAALICLWKKGWCRSRARDAPRSTRAHLEVTVSRPSVRPRQSRSRPSSLQTVVGDGSSLKGSVEGGQSLQ